jgi:tetratricopeptide (TPR) repeat protein
MSPEQAEGALERLGPRSDVYSLGATLYCLLTGRPPFAGDAVEVIPAVQKGEFPPPRAIDASIDRALEAVCLKAMSLRPEDRYGSCRPLAEDIERWMADEPVSAWCEPLSARARRWARRHRTRVTGATAALLAGLIGLAAVAAVQSRANAALEGKNLQLMAANAATAQALAATRAREAETRSVLEFVQQRVFAAARPEGQAGGLGREVTLRKAIEAALPHVDHGFVGRPLIEGRLRDTLGISFLFLGDAEVATAQHERARALFAEQLGPDDPDTLQSVNNLANSYRAQGRFPEALLLYQDTLARRRAVLGADHPATLESLNNLANILGDMGQDGEALKLCEEALRRRRATLGPSHPDTIGSMRNLANSYAALGRFAEALQLEEQALPLATSALGPTHPDTLSIRNNLGLSYADARRFEEALKLQDQTVALLKAELGHDHPDTLRTVINRAKALSDLGRYEEAVQQLKEVLALQNFKPGPGHPQTLHTMYRLAIDLSILQRYEEALHWHSAALAGRKAKLGPDHADTIYSMWGVATNLVRLNRGAEAVPIIDECLTRAAALTPHLRDRFSGLAIQRLKYFRQAGDAEQCRATAALWEKLNPTGPDGLYEAARYRAVAAAVLLAREPTPDSKRRAGAEADRALDWLRKAVAAGFRDLNSILRDTDLDPLRSRPDFQLLLMDLAMPADPFARAD